MAEAMTGGCQCGAVRYTVRVAGPDAGLCHCSMCKRASGGFAAALVQVDPADVRWSGEPARYRSSPIAERLFCRTCGSPLAWAALAGDDMDLMLGSFDEPSRFTPVAHGGAERILEPWLDTAALPRHRTQDIPGSVARWQAAGLEVPE
ncbi:GFA family protein [Erythrobacteraceae bacterium CFH 75059]|uniref:GFA family protein n=1 Tax=Qipengyuania thermophila TaxID=2509361 RepID=UPI001020088A|nr:GFA family protein [Qipengyuania thermophila]TCD05379.1 GFA family protein [Erythrobacteraceae bacterium CFH 75059]